MPEFFEFREKFVASGRKQKPAPGDASGAAKPGGDALSVSQLTRMIDGAIQKNVPAKVLVTGELSNVKTYRASGHLYFTLKDADCCIDCVMWQSDTVNLKFDPADGEAVLVTGNVRVYGERGRYQLYAKSIEPIGKGALDLAFRKLYAKLEAEGLFEKERKRPLPKYPMRIALMTSRNAAALQDMLKVLRRFPWIKLQLIHVAVQGSGAAQEIATALTRFSRESKTSAPRADVILLARGGGSLEDLSAFNDESIARAIFASSIPIVTGIGHEVDQSIADFVADHHAHTPTEAAQVVVNGWRTVRDELEIKGIRLRRAMRVIADHFRQRLELIDRHEIFRRPLERINQLRQRLDDREKNLASALRENLRKSERLLEASEARLRRHHPRFQLKLVAQKIDGVQLRLTSAARANARKLGSKIESLDAQLQAISPAAVLKRGYSITIAKRGGKVVRSIQDVKVGDAIITRVSDGEIESNVEDSKQPKLFE